jgi:hypothetical protein
MEDYNDGSSLGYPNLSACRVVLTSAGGAAHSAPVRLPAQILQAARQPPVAKPYDFALEKTVLQTLKDRQVLWKDTDTNDLDELRGMLARMKSVTNADEDVCASLLKSNDYDLSTSIEAFYQMR